MTNPDLFLRRVLLADAVSAGATGALMALAAEPLAELFALSAPLLRVAGIALLPVALAVAWVARRRVLPRKAVWAIVALNALWVLESLALLVGGWVAPNGLGIAFVLAQAAVVAIVAELEVVGLRRTAVTA